MNKESIIKKQQSTFTKQDIKDTLIFTLPIVVPLVLHKLDTKNKLNEENQKQPWERLLPSYMYPTDIAQTQYNKNLWEKTITFFNLIGHLKQICFDSTDKSYISNQHFQHTKK
jgi:DNA gyrase/topoisomerase IV subunit B